MKRSSHAINSSSKMRRFVLRGVREAVLGLTFGATAALVIRIGQGLLSGATQSQKFDFLGALKPVTEEASNYSLLIALICFGLLFLLASRIGSFILRLYHSWVDEIITGIMPVWFVLALAFFTPLVHHDWKRYLLFVIFGTLPIVASIWAASRRSASRSQVEIAVPEPISVADELSVRLEVKYDLPIRVWSEDRLRRGDFVRTIGGLILREKAPVVAIVGPFGEGKTSVLNLLAASLEYRSDIILVPFTSWLPGDEQALSISLFATIAQQIKKRYVVFGVTRELRRFAILLAGAVPKFGKSLSSFFEAPSQVEQLQGLKRLLNKLPVQIVVLVDELDRMDRPELFVLLKAIRGVTDLPHVTYVCAFDKEAVVKLISEGDTLYGESYLEKFFPMEISLPRVDFGQLAKYFDQGIEGICESLSVLRNEQEKKDFDESVRPLWQSCIRYILRNIRKMTLFLNAFETSLKPVSAEVNVFDMMVLQLVKMISEKTFEFIYDNGPLFYEPSWRITHWEERLSVDDKRESEIRDKRINAFFESLAEPTKTRVKELLSTIFPTVERWNHGMTFSRRRGNAEEAEAERRIYHPDYFPRYFIRQVPADLFGKREMSDFIGKLNAAVTVEDGVAVFRQTIGGLASNPWKRWDFLHGLVNECAKCDLGEAQCEAIIRAVAMISDSLESDVLGLGEWARARALIFVVVGRFSGTPRVQEMLSIAIGQSTSDGFAAEILRYSTTNRNQNSIIEDWSCVEESAIKTAFAQRMRNRYHAGSHREIPYGRRADASSFFLWAWIGDGERVQAIEYFRDKFSRDPIEIGRFLGWVLPREGIYTGDPLSGLDKLFPVEDLLGLVNKNYEQLMEERDRESVKWFLELVKKRGEQDLQGGGGER